MNDKITLELDNSSIILDLKSGKPSVIIPINNILSIINNDNEILLNIDQSLEMIEEGYRLITPLKEYIIKKYVYYIDITNHKVYLDSNESALITDSLGNLTYHDNKAYIEFKCDGIILKTNSIEYSNSNNYEFRNEEYVKLEQEINIHKLTIEEYKYKLSELSKYVNIDSLDYINLYNKSQLLNDIKEDYYNFTKKIDFPYYELNYIENGHSVDIPNGSFNNANFTYSIMPNRVENNEYSRLIYANKASKDYEEISNNSDNTDLKANRFLYERYNNVLGTKETNLTEANLSLEEDINTNIIQYASSISTILTNLIDYNQKELNKKLEQLSTLDLIIPTYFVYKDDIIYGFNKNMKLSYLYFNEIEYTINYNNEKIISIKSNDEQMDITHNEYNSIISIKDIINGTTLLKYNGTILYNIKNSNINISLQNDYGHIVRIADNIAYQLTYLNNKVVSIYEIYKNDTTEEKYHLTYRYDETIVKNMNDTNIHYLFDGDLYSIYEEKNNKIISAKYYDINDCHNLTIEFDSSSKIIYEASNYSSPITITTGLNKHDYIIMAVVDIDQDINFSRSTKYCSHITSTYNNSTYYFSLNVNNNFITTRGVGKQLLLLPTTVVNDLITISFTTKNVNYSISNIKIIEANYVYHKYDEYKNIIYTSMSDIINPKINNSQFAGYNHKDISIDYTYNENNYLSSKITHINDNDYQEYYYYDKNKLIKKEVNNIVYEYVYENNKCIEELYFHKDNPSLTYSIKYNNNNNINSNLNTNYKAIKNNCIKYISDDSIINYHLDYKNRVDEIDINDYIVSILYENDTITINYSDDHSHKYHYVDGKLDLFEIFDNDIRTMVKKYYYDNDKLISTSEHSINGTSIINYTYVDNILAKVESSDYNKLLSFDGDNITRIIYQFNDKNIGYNYEYLDNKLNYLCVGDINKFYEYDIFNRLSTTILNNITHKYSYLIKDNHATNLIEIDKEVINNKVFYTKYTYDENNNITSIITNDNFISYSYNKSNNLIRYNDKLLDKTILYFYDNNGNIIKELISNYTLSDNINIIETINYGYINNKLVSLNDICYEYEDGSIISYGNNLLSYSGNKLVSFNNISFSYNIDGYRIEKKNNNIIHKYILDDNKIIGEYIRNYYQDGLDLSYEEKVIDYLYEGDNIIGFIYDNINYYYNNNIFHDIIEIYDSLGNIVAKYSYDAWGNHEILINVDNIANINPFRYRGYYYDNETDLYYLNYRYYSSKIHRFISIDDYNYIDINSIDGLNLYAYCHNNPVNRIDPTGHYAITLTTLLIGAGISAVIGASIGFGTAVYNDYKEDGIFFNGDWTNYVGRIAGGFISGAGLGIAGVLGAGVGAAVLAGEGLTIFGASTSGTVVFGISVGVSSIFAGGGYSLNAAISKDIEWNANQFGKELLVGSLNGSLSFIGGFIGGYTGTRIPGSAVPLKTFVIRSLIEQEFTAPTKIVLSILKKL